MALEQIRLRKLLKLLFLESRRRRSEIRTDIRKDMAREAGENSSGGDFYAPFWADAKSHVFGLVDLHEMVRQRIEANPRRANLYPQLRSGFLKWWNERRRWTNEPFHPGPPLKSRYDLPVLHATVKVDSILSVRDGIDAEHAVYPYFFPEPVLSEQAARLGLWLLTSALPVMPAQEIRILDVIRGQTFSVDRTPLQGTEEEDLLRRYTELLRQRDALREEYG